MSLNKSSEETPLKSLNNTGIFSFPQGFPSPPEGLASLNLPMVPPHLLLAMQSNLPPEKVREMLTEQAEMLDQMASKLKSAKEDDLESIRGSVSKKVKELEKEIVIEKKINSDWDKRDDLYNNRDIDMLKQEINSIKLREESTYLDLQKAHHQTRMLESQLLELQRKYFSELEHLNFENAELRRKLEAAEYRNASFQKEEEYLRAQVYSLKRQLTMVESFSNNKIQDHYEFKYKEERYEPKFKEEKNDSLYIRDPSPDQSAIVNKKKILEKNEDIEDNPRKAYDQDYETFPKETSPDALNRYKKDKKKEYMPVRTINNASSNVTEALNWKTGPIKIDPNTNIIGNLQSKLNSLTQEYKKLQKDLERVSESKNPNSIKRKAEIELELSICESNINSVTSKLRKLSWLSNS